MTIVPAADPRTHTTRVRLELPAEVRGVYPGVYARAHFVIGRAPRLLVPRAAIVRRSEVTAAYVVDEQGRAHMRQVRLGAAGDEASVEVLAGLKPGERVALEPSKREWLCRGPEHGRFRPHRALLPGVAAHTAFGAGGVPARVFAVAVTPREEEPQITSPWPTCWCRFPASARDVETLVATPAEQVLAQMTGIEHAYSVSRPGWPC